MNEIVYRDYTREELDKQYSNFLQEGAQEAYDAANARATTNHETLQPRTNISYGSGSGQIFDLYHPGSGDVPAIIFMHGGQWQKGDATTSAVAADTIVSQGAALVAGHCDQIPDVRLPDMVDQMTALVRHVRMNATSYGIDPERLCVTGHSSGAHLAAAALVRLANQEDLSGITCGFLISGNYDLRPLMLSYRAGYLELSDAETIALSPLSTLDKPLPPLWMTIGSLESDEFHRQTQMFREAVTQNGDVEFREQSARNHFNANDELCAAASPAWSFLARHLRLGDSATIAAQ